MEDTSDQRDYEIVKMPNTPEEAHQALKIVEGLLDNFKIVSPQVSGSTDMGFSYNTVPGTGSPEGPEGPERPEFPEQ